MRVDATVTLEIRDKPAPIPIEILDAQPDSVVGVQLNAYRNGQWSGNTAGVGTHYPGSRIYSVSATYRTHCGHDACTKPHGKVRATYAADASVPVEEHVHTLPPKPKPAAKGDKKKSGKAEASPPEKK